MASIRRHGKGWRAEVYKAGQRRSKVHPTKREAQDWASRQEYFIANAEQIASSQPFGDVLDRYAREVSSRKRGSRFEILRVESIRRDKLAKIAVGDLTRSDLADWRDRRLREVSASSVRREMNILASVFTHCVAEWGLLTVSPMATVRKPKEHAPRDRLPTSDEMERLALSAGSDLSKKTARTFHAFRFSCETGMRAGEVAGLTWANIDLDARVAVLPQTKNGDRREVPLSLAAVEMLRELPELDPVFDLTPRQIDSLWRKIRDRAKVDGLRYHDSRHAAITRLSKKLDVLALAKMVGHRDIRQLSGYYAETAADIAKRLD